MAEIPAVRRSIVVEAPPAEAFRIYTEHSSEWLPPAHTFVRDPSVVAFEPWVGGRFYERGADGTEVTRGTVTVWEPPARLAVTWRIGPGWRPVSDDEHASVIVVEFNPAATSRDGASGEVAPGGEVASGEGGPADAGQMETGQTEVALTYTHLERHGEMAEAIRSAVSVSSPDDTLHRYADVVARRRAGS